MSVLVTCQRFRPAGEDVETTSVASLARPDAYLAAFERWGIGDVDNWVALPQWRGRSWDDWVNEAAWETETRRELVDALGWLADHSDGIAIWYAGFPDDVPLAADAAESCRLVYQQLAAHDLEPAARLTKPASESRAVRQ